MKKFFRDGSGTSLIECIVALLILGIMSVSLMQMFTSALRVNQANKVAVGGDAVAENVMEIIKKNGLSGMAIGEYKWTSGSLFFGYPVKNVSLAGDPAAEYENNNYKFVPHSDNIYDFTIEGMNEGTGEYNVEIRLDSNYSYNDGVLGPTQVNEKKAYDYAAFYENSSLLINPRSGDSYYDDLALAYFRAANKTHVDLLYQTDKAEKDAINDGLWANYYAYKADHPTETVPLPSLVDLPDPPGYDEGLQYRYRSDDELINLMERDFYINIKADTETDMQYVIESTMVYHISDELNIVQAGAKYTANGFSYVNVDDPEVEGDEVKDIFVFYIPYPYLSEKYFVNDDETKLYKNLSEILLARTDSTTNQRVYLENTTGLENLNVYIIVQGKDGVKLEKTLKTGISSRVSGCKDCAFISNAKLSYTGKNSTVFENILKETGTEHRDNIIKVNINVYKVNGEEKDLVRSMSSTVVTGK